MGMFGRSPQALLGQNPPVPVYQTPGIGDGIPGNRRIDGTMAPQPIEAAALRPEGSETPFAAQQTIDPSQLNQTIASRAPAFFDKNGGWRDVAGTLLDGVSMAFNGPGAYWPAKQRLATEQREDARWMQRQQYARNQTIEDREYEANKPQYWSGEGDRVKYDPKTNQATTVYDAPSNAEEYARGMGYNPGTDEWRTAMQDYTLRGWGSTALGNKAELEDQRFGNRADLKRVPTYRDTHPRPLAPRPTRLPTTQNVIADVLGKVGAGKPLSPGETEIYSTWRSGRGRGSRSSAADPLEGRTATDASGNKIVRRNGKWVPAP